nr:lysophosphatidic acid receptor 6-like [Pogona vitticeps]
MENATLTPVQWDQGLRNASTECRLQADFQYSLFTVIYSTVFVLGLLENGAALYLLACRVQKNAPRSYLYLVNLAVVDALFAGVLPFKIHYHFHHNHWVFGDVACRITGCMYFLNIYLSIAFFTCVCVDRYVAVLHPFAYIRIKRGHYAVVASVLWVTALSIAGPLVLGGPLHAQLNSTTVCFENFGPTSWTGRMVPYNVCALIFGFTLPFAVILISYPLIARRIAHIPHSARRRKALGTIYLILFICATCFLPYHLTHLLHFLMRAKVIENCRFAAFIYKMRRVTLALVSFNCCLNPILYYFTAAGGRWPFWIRRRTVHVYTISKDQAARRGSALRDVADTRPTANGARLVRPPRKLVGL